MAQHLGWINEFAIDNLKIFAKLFSRWFQFKKKNIAQWISFAFRKFGHNWSQLGSNLIQGKPVYLIWWFVQAVGESSSQSPFPFRFHLLHKRNRHLRHVDGRRNVGRNYRGSSDRKSANRHAEINHHPREGKSRPLYFSLHQLGFYRSFTPRITFRLLRIPSSFRRRASGAWMRVLMKCTCEIAKAGSRLQPFI